MNKKMLAALILLLFTALVLVFNSIGSRSGRIDVDLIFTTIRAVKSLAFLGFIVIGVAIGLLLK
ncbi:MAG: hypothetical protein ABR497_02090 [Kiritimatiellia bacterium]|nr:hypothetical protein [Lentisphaerota bacterium]